jgi:hypothetical protein
MDRFALGVYGVRPLESGWRYPSKPIGVCCFIAAIGGDEQRGRWRGEAELKRYAGHDRHGNE